MKRCYRQVVLLMIAGFLVCSGTATAAGTDQGSFRAKSSAQEYFTDVELINQDGQPMRFYSDLLQGKIVVIHSFFTRCTGVCPPMCATMAQIQTWLGDRLGRDAHLISISVDPEYDTPARLKEYADALQAKSGWYFLTGKKENVMQALRKVGHHTDDKEAHSNLMIIGNEGTRLWKKAFGVADPNEIIQIVNEVIHDDGQ